MYNQNTIVINLKKNISSNDPENHGKRIYIYRYRRVMTPNCWNVRFKNNFSRKRKKLFCTTLAQRGEKTRCCRVTLILGGTRRAQLGPGLGSTQNSFRNGR